MATRHDPKTIAVHWITAGLVVLLWLSAQFIDYFPKGPSRWNMLGLHMSMGIALGLLTVYRIRWRISQRSRWPAPLTDHLKAVATTVHMGLYVLLIAAVLLGLWNAWARGEHVFNLFQIPAFDEGNKALRKWAGDQHKLAANVILILSGVHAAIAIAHHVLWRDGVLQRMLPQRVSEASFQSRKVDAP